MMKHQIKTTKKIAIEIMTALATGFTGHAPDPLSPEALEVMKEIDAHPRDWDFDITDLTPDERAKLEQRMK